ncbi:hypothetical protein JCM6882_004026 [Rhodosporidiobolus microsporus]
MDTAVLRGDDKGNYRIVVWGNSGAGKSTLAKRLTRVLPGLEEIDMDSLYWNDNWVKTPTDELMATLNHLSATHDSWVIDGNSLKRRSAFLPRATDIVWLDFPFDVTLWRLLKRTFWRWWTQERLFGTNCREDIRETLFSKESIIWWCLTIHRPLRRDLTALLAANEMGVHDKLRRRFTRTGEVEEWFKAVEEGARKE